MTKKSHNDRVREILERINLIAQKGSYETDSRSLLHAYVACLSFNDICAAVTLTLASAVSVRQPLRGRLLRVLREDHADVELSTLVSLIEQTSAAANDDKTVRQVVDALHSAVFSYLPLPAQQMLLDRWIDRGKTGSMARWLKATKQEPSLYDAEVALNHWRASGDIRAAKSLAYQASPDILAKIAPEIIGNCSEGWLIAKTAIRAKLEDETSWDCIRERNPATYLYLCAQMSRPISEDEAFELVSRCGGSLIDGDRGLAIWAVGQMRMLSVLDRINGDIQTLLERDMAEERRRYPWISKDEPKHDFEAK